MNFREIVIETEGRELVYRFDLLTVEQAEIGRELGDYKYHLLQNPPSDFRDLLQSRAVDWLTTIVSYLLFERRDGQIRKYERNYSEGVIFELIKNLSVLQRQKLWDIVEDFFQNIESIQKYSVIRQGEYRRDNLGAFMKLMTPIIKEMNYLNDLKK